MRKLTRQLLKRLDEFAPVSVWDEQAKKIITLARLDFDSLDKKEPNRYHAICEYREKKKAVPVTKTYAEAKAFMKFARKFRGNMLNDKGKMIGGKSPVTELEKVVDRIVHILRDAIKKAVTPDIQKQIVDNADKAAEIINAINITFTPLPVPVVIEELTPDQVQSLKDFVLPQSYVQ